MPPRRDAMVAAILVAVGSLFFLVAARFEVVNPFLYSLLAYVHLTGGAAGPLETVTTGGFPWGDPAYFPAYPLLLRTLSAATALPPERLAVLPVGLLLFVPLVLVLARRVAGGPLLAGLLAFGFLAEPTHATGLYSVFHYAWAYTLFFTFLVLILFFSGPESRPGAGAVVALVLVFLSTQVLYWTTAVWMILVAGALWLLQRGSGGPWARRGGFLLLAVVAFFALNEVVYRTVAPRLLYLAGEDPLRRLWVQLASLSLGGSGLALPFEHVPSGGLLGRASGAITLLIHGVLLAPPAYFAWRALRGRARPAGPMAAFLWALVLAAFAHSAIYGAYGRFSFRLNLLVFPLVGVALLRLHGHPRAAHAFAGVLAVLFAAKFVTLALGGTLFLPSSVDDGAAAGAWLARHDASERVLADFHTLGMLSIGAAHEGETLDVEFLSPASYGRLVREGPAPGGRSDAFAFNAVASGFPAEALGWYRFEPLGRHWDEVQSRPGHVRAYDDGRMVLLLSAPAPTP